MKLIYKIIICLITLVVGIIVIIGIRNQYELHLIRQNATYLDSYDTFIASDYEEISGDDYIELFSDYLEKSNIHNDLMLRKKIDFDDRTEYYTVLGTKDTPQLVLKLETKLSDLGEISPDTTNAEILDLLAMAGDDKYTLSFLTGDNILLNQKDVSNTFVELTFTLKSLYTGSIDLRSFSATGGCVQGTFAINETTEGSFEQANDSCSEIFERNDFSKYLEEIFIEDNQ